jgi:hypothetical protein
MPVNVPRPEYSLKLSTWQRCRDVLAGSDAVKAGGTTYLPKVGSGQPAWPNHYETYKARALFVGFASRTLEALVGLVFSRDPSVKLPDDARTKLAAAIEDIDQAGASLNDFALRTLEEVISVGRFGVLVDFDGDGTPVAARRPYLVGYPAEAVINWQATNIGGDYALSRVVLRECDEEPDSADAWRAKPVDRLRVLELVELGGRRVYTQTVYRTVDGELRQLDEPVTPTRRGVPLDFIPFVFINPSNIRADVAKPPLNDLCLTSLSHYASSADLEWARHFAAMPTYWVRNAEAKGDLPIGPTNVWKLGADGACGVLELEGKALEELRLALKEKEEQMAVLGARLIERAQAKAETAESVKSRNAAAFSSLRTMAGSVSAGLTVALRWLVWWAGHDLNAGEVGIELNRDFIDQAITADELKSLVAAHQEGAISFETLYHNLTRGGRTRPGVSADEERAAIAASKGAA